MPPQRHSDAGTGCRTGSRRELRMMDVPHATAHMGSPVDQSMWAIEVDPQGIGRQMEPDYWLMSDLPELPEPSLRHIEQHEHNLLRAFAGAVWRSGRKRLRISGPVVRLVHR
jgi:hypothetical protein